MTEPSMSAEAEKLLSILPGNDALLGKKVDERFFCTHCGATFVVVNFDAPCPSCGAEITENFDD